MNRLFTARLRLEADDRPVVVDRREVHVSRHPPCKVEAQDFFDEDRQLTFACYHSHADGGEDTQVMGIDLATRKVTDYTQAAFFSEPEGIFPDGKHTLIESDRHARPQGRAAPKTGWNIDIYKLALDGTGKHLTRLTHFNDFEGWHASNPVVSPDGSYMAFQLGRVKDGGAFTGAGFGIFLQRFGGAATKRPRPAVTRK